MSELYESFHFKHDSISNAKKYQFKYDNFSSDIWESQVLIMSFNLNKTQHE